MRSLYIALMLCLCATAAQSEELWECSEKRSGGIVWEGSATRVTPFDESSFTMSVDYYRIELEDEPLGVGLQFVLNRELRENMGGLQGIDLGAIAIERAPDGSVLSAKSLNFNAGKTKTAGFDVMVNYEFSLGAVGDFSAKLQGSKMHYNDIDADDGRGLVERQNTFLPPWRATLSLDWSLGDYSAVLVGNGIADAPVFFNQPPFQVRIGSMVTWDLQFGWAMPGDGRLVIGARNIFDRDPPVEPVFNSYSHQLHDIYGRVPYIRYEQNL